MVGGSGLVVPREGKRQRKQSVFDQVAEWRPHMAGQVYERA
jgi:hypothetical protein